MIYMGLQGVRNVSKHTFRDCYSSIVYKLA